MATTFDITSINGLTPKLPLTSDPIVLRSLVGLKFQQIEHCLLTSPGENLSDLEYGVGMNQLLFENDADAFGIDRILSRVKPQLSRISSVAVEKVSILTEANNPHSLRVVINLSFDFSKTAIKQIAEYTVFVDYDDSGKVVGIVSKTGMTF